MSPRGKVAVLLLCLGLPGAAAAWPAPEPGGAGAGIVVVTLRPTARVDAPCVLVSAVASVQGTSAALRQRIAGLDLVEIAEGHRAAVVSREQVSYRIRLAGIDANAFRVTGAKETLVSLVRSALSAEAVLAAAKEQLLSQLPRRQEAVLRPVVPIAVPRLQLADSDEVALAAEVVSSGLAGSPARVEVTVFVNGERRRVVPVLLEVRFLQSVPVAKVRIERGQAVSPDVFQLEPRPADEAARAVRPESLGGKRARRTILAGQVLTAADIESPEEEVLVKPRDMVKLVARVGSMRVVAVGEALQEGRAGQMVRVRNVDSNKVVTGRVVERLVVEVSY
jgi:flagella basal body P-ring formation protein FlgA